MPPSTRGAIEADSPHHRFWSVSLPWHSPDAQECAAAGLLVQPPPHRVDMYRIGKWQNDRHVRLVITHCVGHSGNVAVCVRGHFSCDEQKACTVRVRVYEYVQHCFCCDGRTAGVCTNCPLFQPLFWPLINQHSRQQRWAYAPRTAAVLLCNTDLYLSTTSTWYYLYQVNCSICTTYCTRTYV